MMRNGRTYRLLQRFIVASDLWIIPNSHRYFVPFRNYAEGKDPKVGKGATAKVEECLPSGSIKKIPAANMKPCPPPTKIKIPNTPPVKNPTPKICQPKTDTCKQQPVYAECKPGANRNPVVQVCRKPNMMEDCSKIKNLPPCGDDPDPPRKKLIRNILLGVVMFAMLSYFAYSYLSPKEEPQNFDKMTSPPRKKRRARVTCKDPINSSEIPNSVPYLLIGGGTAAFSAFRSIKSLDPTAQVLVITDERYFPYMRPPLSKEMWFNDDPEQVQKLMFKQWNGTVRSIYYEPKSFYTDLNKLTTVGKGGVAVARGWSVSKIFPYERKIELEDGYCIKYGKCLIATGTKPKTLKVFERSPCEVQERVQTYRDIFDFEDLNEMVEENDSITIIGGGFLGSELACALARKGRNKNLKVTQIFKESGNMGKVLPEYLSLWTTKKVEAEGVKVITNSQVVDAGIFQDKLSLTLNTGQKVGTDHCVVAVGAEPNTEFAARSQLEVDPELGGFLVNAELQARSHLFVAGDAASFYDLKFGRRRIEHHDHAVVSGRLAGENMVGAGKPYWHQSMFWSDLGPEVGYEAIGIVDAKLPTVGVFAKQTKQDTPEAVVNASGESMRSQSEENAAPVPPATGSPQPPQPGEDFGKGVVFYLRDDIVVGIVMWNVFNRMQVARQVLKEERKYDDLNEVAKLFNIHEE